MEEEVGGSNPLSHPSNFSMQTIHYTLKNKTDSITWAISEQFNELRGQRFNLNQMEATQIEELTSISPIAKILLSAVAGAVIQRLIDDGCVVDDIFSFGSFIVD